jgi:general secretion pathway protein F
MSRRLGLDDLIAVNDEIAALVRAGVPLERGLLGLGRDVRGRLGALARRIGEEMRRGASLSEALERAGPDLPATYRAVVEAGLRAGRLPAALEDVAAYARAYVDLRRAIGQAFVRPLIVLMMAYALFLAFLLLLIPRIRVAFESLGISGSGIARALECAGQTAVYWGAIPPLLVALGVIVWIWLGRARGLDATRALGWAPWLRSVMADWRASNFAGWLALLLDHGVPLAESLELAGAASGDARLRDAAQAMAERARRGQTPHESFRDQSGLPPLVQWLLVTGERQGALASAVKHAAATYRRRAQERAETVRVVIPPLLLLGIGGGSALLYVLTLYLPWTSLLHNLSRPSP